MQLNYDTWLHWLIDTHSYRDLIAMGRMYMHYAVNSTTDNANFVHQVEYVLFNEIKITICKVAQPSMVKCIKTA